MARVEEACLGGVSIDVRRRHCSEAPGPWTGPSKEEIGYIRPNITRCPH